MRLRFLDFKLGQAGWKSEGRTARPRNFRDGEMVIECRGCPCAQDLADPACMRCALSAMADSPSIRKVVLSRSLDVAYEGRSVEVIRELAEVVGMCRAGVPVALDRQCHSCPSRPTLVLGALADSIPYGWTEHAGQVSPPAGRGRCASCAEQVNEVLSAARARLRAVERSIAREAFMIVGESGHA